MTREEAARILRADDVEWNEIFDSESGLLDEALEVAIKSLEAWEKVKEEIKQIRIHRDYLDVQGVTIIEILEIIDKHLGEVDG